MANSLGSLDHSGAANVTKTTGHHGEVRGLNLSRRSSQFEGRFGRMFRTLPAARFTEDMLKDLARAMTAEAEADFTPEEEVDDEENTGISAGYTYLGQFIDHDLTFDPVSSLQRQNDPDGLVDYRTPRFDLDCVYGRGPDDQPYLYRQDGRHMLLGDALTGNAKDSNTRGLPRITAAPGERARAVIGDPRNDENVIVSQLQSAMLRFHNRMADLLPAADFEEVQRMIRWHYQWVVLHDFLPTIAGQQVIDDILGHLHEGDIATAAPPQLKFYKPEKEAFIPLEFSVAAYRFGHSMVRPIYRLNQGIPRLPIFSVTGESLLGFRQFPSNWAIEWGLYFNMGGADPSGPRRLQPAYKIDTSLVNPLGNLPESVATRPPSLPERNLLRGWRMALPSGQAVARAMGVPVIPDDKLKVGKATAGAQAENKKLTDISPQFAGNAPLWYYILAEAQQQFDGNDATPIRLGPVGGRIVAEVFIGLMQADSHSYLRQNRNFKPMPEVVNATTKQFNMADLLVQSGQG
jgi:hypothetical protein